MVRSSRRHGGLHHSTSSSINCLTPQFRNGLICRNNPTAGHRFESYQGVRCWVEFHLLPWAAIKSEEGIGRVRVSHLTNPENSSSQQLKIGEHFNWRDEGLRSLPTRDIVRGARRSIISFGRCRHRSRRKKADRPSCRSSPECRGHAKGAETWRSRLSPRHISPRLRPRCGA